MRQIETDQNRPTSPIGSRFLNHFSSGVDPEEKPNAVLVANRDAVRPRQIRIDDDGRASAVEIGLRYERDRSPVRPIEIAVRRIDDDVARTFHAAPDDDASLAPVEVAHFDFIRSGVCPVDFLVDPIDGQAGGNLEVIRRNHFLFLTWREKNR